MSMSGEMLGEKNQEKLFSIILKREENLVCADCPTKAPTWVSLDFGVFVCTNCSGAHRYLSRKVTRVYSTQIDSWNKSNFQIMDHVGNEIANSYWEFKKPQRQLAANSDPEERVRFVTDKYVRKQYANPKSQNPVLTFLQKRDKGILERPYQNREHQLSPPVTIIGEKEFISYGESLTVQSKQLKQNIEKKFNSVNYVNYAKPTVDLLELDEPSPISQKPQQKVQQPKVNQKLPPLPPQKPISQTEDSYSMFVQAPQVNKQPQSTNLLDLDSDSPVVSLPQSQTPIISALSKPPQSQNGIYSQQKQQQQQQSFGAYPSQQQQYSVSTAQQQQYGAPTAQQQQYGTPTVQQQQQYGAPPTQQQQYGAPTAQQQQYGASTAQSQQYGASTFQQQQHSNYFCIYFFYDSNSINNNNPINQVQQPQKQTVDLMSLYNQSSTSSTSSSSTSTSSSNQLGQQQPPSSIKQPQQQQQQQQQWQPVQPAQPVQVDKNRYQAFNQMNSYGTAYYPYYQQQNQMFGAYNQQGYPNNFQSFQQWK